MTTKWSGDAVLLTLTIDELLDEVRQSNVAGGIDVETPVGYVLERAGLVNATGDPTLEGKSLFRLNSIQGDHDGAVQALGLALRVCTPVQALETELRGLGPVTEIAALDSLMVHRCVDATADIDEVRPGFRMLNDLGLIVYSRRAKTVRLAENPVDVALPGESARMAAMISPRTPFTNIVNMRRILRPMTGVIWWADPHFGARALEELMAEVDSTRVTEIRIISQGASNVVSKKAYKDFDRFRDEMATLGVTASWRVDSTRDWHDRWLIDDASGFNLPPVNSLYMNQHAEILPTPNRPPLEEWWDRSVDFTPPTD